jgi:hypothetical protein
MVDFVPGWSLDHCMVAQTHVVSSGMYATVADDGKPLPKAYSLADKRLNYYIQGSVGTCHIHAAKDVAEISANALGYEAFPVCRALIGYAGMRLLGGGNAADGGSPTTDIQAMTATQGVGMAHERLYPYRDDRDYLGMKPPQNVFDDAKKSHLIAPVLVSSLDQAKKLIVSGRPVANGIQCPASLQDQGSTFIASVGGRYLGGHAMTLISFVEAGVFDQYAWLNLNNSWGLIYKPISPALAAKVPGYKPITPAATSDFWIRQDFYIGVCQQGCEHVSGTDVDGIARKDVPIVASNDLAKRIGDIFLA